MSQHDCCQRICCQLPSMVQNAAGLGIIHFGLFTPTEAPDAGMITDLMGRQDPSLASPCGLSYP